METAVVHRGLYRDNGKENGSYYSILGVHRVIMGDLGIVEKTMETIIQGSRKKWLYWG